MAGNMHYMNSAKIKLGTWNIGALNGKGLDLTDMLAEILMDFRGSRWI